jgi:hypothetical protein
MVRVSLKFWVSKAQLSALRRLIVFGGDPEHRFLCIKVRHIFASERIFSARPCQCSGPLI